MQCQICSTNTATIHLTEITGGQRVETHLCQECAQKQGLAVKNQVPLNELLSTLLAVQPEAQTSPFGTAAIDEGDPNLSCPKCGMTMDQFRKDSQLGCPDDYEIFGDALKPIIKNVHGGNTKHRGKIPSDVPADTKVQAELTALQAKLEAAVKAEDYETAAKLRDQIEHLKT